MSNCAAALAQNKAIQLSNINMQKDYESRVEAARLVWQEAERNRDSLLREIDQRHADGFYIDPNSSFVEIDGRPYDCNTNYGSAVCCYSADIKQTKCCACGKFKNCNSGGGCLGICNAECKNGRLFENRKQLQIDQEKRAVYDNINEKYRAYVGIPPPTFLPLYNIGCCQEITIQNISAKDILFDNISNTCSVPQEFSSEPNYTSKVVNNDLFRVYELSSIRNKIPLSIHSHEECVNGNACSIGCNSFVTNGTTCSTFLNIITDWRDIVPSIGNTLYVKDIQQNLPNNISDFFNRYNSFTNEGSTTNCSVSTVTGNEICVTGTDGPLLSAKTYFTNDDNKILISIGIICFICFCLSCYYAAT